MYAGVERNESRRKGIVILMSHLYHIVMVDFACVSAKILKIKVGVKVNVVITYSPS